jgi:hypothetical protein
LQFATGNRIELRIGNRSKKSAPKNVSMDRHAAFNPFKLMNIHSSDDGGLYLARRNVTRAGRSAFTRSTGVQ